MADDAVKVSGSQVFVIRDGKALDPATGQEVALPASAEDVINNNRMRGEIDAAISALQLLSPDVAKRIDAVKLMLKEPDITKLPMLEKALSSETDNAAKALMLLARAAIMINSDKPQERLEAAKALAQNQTPDTVLLLNQRLSQEDNKEVRHQIESSLRTIQSALGWGEKLGALFTGISLGSILLLVALGLAITYGLMGVINMAHGELIAVGAYTTYVIQNIFATGLKLSPFGISISIPGMNLSGGSMALYFVVAIPASFIIAALVGVLLERSVIQFLYKRPLESLLATWGISLVMQQIMKFIFGSNNVQVTSPAWLSGNWTVNDIVFGWNRVFVISFAVLIIVVTWLVLNKTSLGLLIRAVMQNRNMAACMGIRTERVNTMTFAFGCGLAGLAGAFLSQIGNVGPSMGQLYIVDSFMTVVVGGVGNIMGTVISALGIGVADQTLQQYLGNPVIGKILVLGAIILFLQWRPAGIFVTRSRSLD